jgi:hypothetical protein
MAMTDSFRAARWVRTLNLVLQAILFLTFFAGLNYVAHNHPALRIDLTHNRNFSLSPETISYLHGLPRPVHIVVTMTDETRSPELRGLLEEFRHATEENQTGKITIDYIDVYQDRRKAEQFGIDTADVVLLRCGDKPRALPIDDLYRTKSVNGKPERVSFQGEQVLTAALLDVSSSSRQQVYFIVGHGELRPDDTNERDGLSMLRDQLRARNFDVDTLELSVARTIKKDSLLIIVNPQSRYTAGEEEMLRQYLREQAGRMIMFLGPGKPVTDLGLDDLLLDWGILVDDDVIIDPTPESTADNGDLMIRFLDEKHPINQALVSRQYGPLRLGLTRSVQPDPGRSLGSGLNVVALAAASPAAWGERSFGKPGPMTFDPGIDIRPLPGMATQLGVAVASERVSVKDNLPFSVRSGRLVVFGTGDMLANSRIAIAGNLAMFFGAVNWSVPERDNQINVPARPIERFQLALSATDLHRLNYSLWFVLPGITAVLGLVVYWARRT